MSFDKLLSHLIDLSGTNSHLERDLAPIPTLLRHLMLLHKPDLLITILNGLKLLDEPHLHISKLDQNHLLRWAYPGTAKKWDVFPHRSKTLPTFRPKFLRIRAPHVRIELHEAEVHIHLRTLAHEDGRVTVGATSAWEHAVREASANGSIGR